MEKGGLCQSEGAPPLPLKSPAPRATRLDANAWIAAALDALADGGVDAVRVEPLAKRLGVTKGSFYWHFPTREALLKAALERWEREDEEDIFGPLAPIADPRARLRELFDRIAHELPSHVIFAALLKALDHPLVLPVIERVSQRRLDFLTVAYRQAGLDKVAAGLRARLAYTAYAGFLQLARAGLPRLSHEEFERYMEHVMQTLLPAPD